jgi:hypothetical protein
MAIKNFQSPKARHGGGACNTILKNKIIPTMLFWAIEKFQLPSDGGVCQMEIEEIWSPYFSIAIQHTSIVW